MFCTECTVPQEETMMHINKSAINSEWILLDNCFKVNFFCSAKLLKNIHQVKGSMQLHCQSGTGTINLMGTLSGYPDLVWVSPDGITNVLSLSKVKDMYTVIYDSRAGNTFIVKK